MKIQKCIMYQGNKRKCMSATVLETRLNDYIEGNRRLEKQIKALHLIVEGMFQEVLDVQQEREHLELHRKMLCSPVPCSGTCTTLYGGPSHCSKCYKPTCESIIKDLYKKYRHLQDIYKAKGNELLELRLENEILKEKNETSSPRPMSKKNKRCKLFSSTILILTILY